MISDFMHQIFFCISQVLCFICMVLFGSGVFNDGTAFVSLGSWEAGTGRSGRDVSPVLSSILQRHEHGLLSPSPWRRGDIVALSLWSSVPKTLGSVGRRGRGRLVFSQPLRASSFRGRICLLRSRARNLRLNTDCLVGYYGQYFLRCATEICISRIKDLYNNYKPHRHITMCIFWAKPEWTTL